MHTHLSRLLALLGLSVLVLGAPAQVAASCMEPPPLEQAVASGEIVFVGTVINLTSENRWAMVQVEEVWRGPDLPPLVEVRGGPEPGTFSSVDRTYRPGARYLFVVTPLEDVLGDSACSSTTEWTEDLARLRPDDARPVTATENGEDDGIDLASVAIAAVLALSLGVALFGVVALRRRT